MGRYFDKLPIVHYNGMYARNLLAKVQFSDETAKNASLYYPYTLKDHEHRTDIVAAKYYDDPHMAWLINLCNGVIDSQYALGLPAADFERFIKAKYGSVPAAQATVLYYKNDWESDDSVISVAAFDALSTSLKKYYTASIGFNGDTIGYERKKEDWIVDTNRLVRIPLGVRQATVDEWFEEGDDRGFVYAIDADYIYLKHLVGEFVDEEVLGKSLADDEASYWVAVTAYDDEQQKNLDKREIRLIDNRFASEVELELERLLK